jgi:hypothetical protein
VLGAAVGFFAAPARLKGLVIGAAALVLIVLALTTWALFERSGRLELKVELVTAQAQAQVWQDAAGRCSESVERAASAGAAAVAETKRLVDVAERAFNERNAALRDEIRGIVSKPAPTRPDGKPKVCGAAWAEIRRKVQP